MISEETIRKLAKISLRANHVAVYKPIFMSVQNTSLAGASLRHYVTVYVIISIDARKELGTILSLSAN